MSRAGPESAQKSGGPERCWGKAGSSGIVPMQGDDDDKFSRITEEAAQQAWEEVISTLSPRERGILEKIERGEELTATEMRLGTRAGLRSEVLKDRALRERLKSRELSDDLRSRLRAEIGATRRAMGLPDPVCCVFCIGAPVVFGLLMWCGVGWLQALMVGLVGALVLALAGRLVRRGHV